MVAVKYGRAPVGWWQDAAGQAQPPGSFLCPSLRVSPRDAGTPAAPATAAPLAVPTNTWSAAARQRRSARHRRDVTAQERRPVA